MVGVTEHFGCDRPGMFPRERVVIHQQAHQLCHGNGGVGVIQLDCDLIGQSVDVSVLAQMTANKILQGCRCEEKLLPKAQLLPGRCGITGV